ncbi:MAG: hypothetical protein AAGM22_09645 [Acidobacteriota bacterium]
MNRVQSRILLIVLVLGALVAAPSFGHGGNRLIGSWISTSAVDGGGELQTLWTFNRGGTVVVSSSGANFSAAHGAWEKVGPRTFEVVNTAFGFAPDGSLAFTLENRATFEVSQDRQTFTAVFESEVKALDGTVLSTSSGSATGTRINVH